MALYRWMLAGTLAFGCIPFPLALASAQEPLPRLSQALPAPPQDGRRPWMVNDPLFKDQSYLKRCRIDLAWTLQRGSAAVKVAVIDGEVDPLAEDLSGKVVAEERLVESSPRTHATPIAGIIAAKTNNGIGIAGIGQTSIVSIMAQGPFNFPEKATSQAFYSAVKLGARVINCSFGTPSPTKRLLEAINYAIDHGVVVVASAMNEGNDVPHVPAALPGVISVGSVDSGNRPSLFSNFGDWLSVMAPGEQLMTTFPLFGQEYGTFSGTSAAAAVVSGVVALMIAQNPSLTPAEIKAILQRTARPLTPMGFDPATGHGLIDAYAAVYAAGAISPRAVGE